MLINHFLHLDSTHHTIFNTYMYGYSPMLAQGHPKYALHVISLVNTCMLRHVCTCVYMCALCMCECTVMVVGVCQTTASLSPV